jgi:hypothetical protein
VGLVGKGLQLFQAYENGKPFAQAQAEERSSPYPFPRPTGKGGGRRLFVSTREVSFGKFPTGRYEKATVVVVE